MASPQRENGDTPCERIVRAAIDAFNRRDRQAWTAVFHSESELRPTPMAGAGSLYRGPDGAGRYLDELVSNDPGHRTRILETRMLDADRCLVLSEIVLGDEVVSPGAAIVRVDGEKIMEAAGYLDDEATLVSLGLIPESPA